jgi:uncharacterized damage-inducible protein DinB
MNLKDILLLYDYNAWADARLLGAAAGLSPEQFAGPVAALPRLSHRSLRDTLVHTLGAHWLWRSRCLGHSPTVMLSPDEFPTLEVLQARWQEEVQEMRRFLSGLSDADIDRVISYTDTQGRPHENTLWHILVHMVNHSTQHRSEAAIVLTEWGRSPGNLDLIIFLRI